MKYLKFKFYLLIIFLLLSSACNLSDGETNNINSSKNFNRSAMLTHWADDIIIPAYKAFQMKMTALKTASDIFIASPSESTLQSLRAKWQDAYIIWQRVAMFEIGPAEDFQYRGFMNTYPTNISTIESGIASGTYSLVEVSTQDEQGFPAIDYLINGLSNVSNTEIITFYTSNVNANNYKAYLNNVVVRMNELTSQITSGWNSYRNTFVNNSGSSASSSVDRYVNDFVFYYEKILRAGKIGIPAGVFSDEPISANIESYYKADISKQLFNAALDATQDFFNGKYFNDTTTAGKSLKNYLDFLNTVKNGEDLSTLINNQFNAIRISATNLSDNFKNQIETNNNLMLATYDKLQANTVLLKVDMLQALDINVDFIDADGD